MPPRTQARFIIQRAFSEIARIQEDYALGRGHLTRQELRLQTNELFNEAAFAMATYQHPDTGLGLPFRVEMRIIDLYQKLRNRITRLRKTIRTSPNDVFRRNVARLQVEGARAILILYIGANVQ